MTREQLLQLWKQRKDDGNVEGAAEVAAIIQGLEEPVVTDEVALREAEIEEYKEISPLPSAEPAPETERPPKDTTPSGRAFRAVEEVLYPGRSTEWVNDALEGGLERFVESEGEALGYMAKQRENWEMFGELGGWAATLLLAPGSGGASLAAGPTLAGAGAGIMATLYEEFMNQGQDLDEIPGVVRRAMLYNTLASGLPTIGGAVMDTIARFITGVKMGSLPFRKRTAEVMRKAREEATWLDDVWQRYKMVGGNPDPSASGKRQVVQSSKAFGRFVLVGHFFQKRAQDHIKKTNDWFAKQLEKVAPVIDPETLGAKWATDAAVMGRWMLESLDSMYDDMFAAAAPIDDAFKAQGGVVPTQKLKAYADEVLGNVRRQLPETEDVVIDVATGKPKYTYDYDTGTVIPVTQIKEMMNFTADQWQRWVINNFGRARDFTTLRRLKNMKDIISDALHANQNTPGFDTTVLKGAMVATQNAVKDMERYLLTLPADEYAYKVAGRELTITPTQLASRAAFTNKTFNEVMNLLEGPAAQRHHAVDRNFWKRAHLMGNYTEPGNSYADEMFTLAFKGNKLQYLKDLRMLVGDEAFNLARVRYMKDIVDASFIQQAGGESLFSVRKFLELSGMNSHPRIMDELLRGTPMTRQKMKNFMQLMSDYDISFDITKMQFRRGAIGGTKAVIGGITAIGAAGGTTAAIGGDWKDALPGALLGVFLLRQGGRLFTSEWAFKQLSSFARAERAYYSGQMTKAKYIVALEKAIAYFGLPGEEDMVAEEAGMLKEEDFEFDALMNKLYPSMPTEKTGPLYPIPRSQ